MAATPSWAVALYPAAGLPRALLIRPKNAALPDALTGFDAKADAGLRGQQWAWSEVLSGIATLTAPVVDLFVPQMLNYESVGGVNFKKGCYPGQEVVARSQFRGAIKRRAYLAHGVATALPKAGDEIYSSEDMEQPCGVVVQLAPSVTESTHDGFDAIVSIKTEAASQSLFIRPAPAQYDTRETGETGDAPDHANAAPISIALTNAPYPILEDI